MKKFLLAVILALSTFGLAATTTPTMTPKTQNIPAQTQSDSTVYTSPDKVFSVELPGAPKVETEDNGSTFSVDDAANAISVFIVESFNTKETSSKDAAKSVIAEGDARVINEMDTTVSDLPAYLVVVDLGDGARGIYLVVLKGKTLVQLLVSSPKPTEDNFQEAQAIYSSLTMN